MALVRRLLDAIEERIGFRAAWRHVADEPIRGGARMAYVFGSLLLGLIAVQIVSGLALALDYSPSVDAAYASVTRIMDRAQSPLGWLVRAMHHNGASFLVVLLALHLVQVAVFRAYRRPREANWLTGLVLAVVVLAFAFTGYLLPWDQTAYYATRVGLNIASSTPVVGPFVGALLQGGGVMGNLTLTRFYAIHVLVLPGALLTLVAFHLTVFRRHGVTPHPKRTEAELRRVDPFWPNQAARDAAAILGVVVLLVLFSLWRGADLGIKADPSAPFDARPEWYFYWLFQLLHWFEPPWDWVGTMGIPGAIALFLFLLPWIDGGQDAKPVRRKLALGGVGAILGGIGALTIYVTVHGRASATTAWPRALEAAPAMSNLEIGMLYGDKCTECHYRTGAPNDPDAPDFRDPEFARMAKANYEKMVTKIKEGGDIMPPFGEELTDAEIRAILDRIVLRFPETNPLPKDATGKGASDPTARSGDGDEGAPSGPTGATMPSGATGGGG